MTAAVGVAVGLGFAGSAVLSVLLTWVVLTAVTRIEARLTRRPGGGATPHDAPGPAPHDHR